jgi:hypothetical protein
MEGSEGSFKWLKDCHYQVICYAEAHGVLADLLRLTAAGYIAWLHNAAISLLPQKQGQ